MNYFFYYSGIAMWIILSLAGVLLTIMWFMPEIKAAASAYSLVRFLNKWYAHDKMTYGRGLKYSYTASINWWTVVVAFFHYWKEFSTEGISHTVYMDDNSYWREDGMQSFKFEGKLYVEKAAIALGDGSFYAVPRPKRHSDVIDIMVKDGHPTPITGEQGFVLSDGRFVDRKEAYVVAKEAEQFVETYEERMPGTLFSEDVW